jgi:hypothetical protein
MKHEMRPRLFVSIIVLIASTVLAQNQQPQPSPPKATIQGLVVRAGTGVPLKGVRISFQRSAQQPQPAVPVVGMPGMLNAVTPVVTDAVGRFLVTGVEAGQYRIFAERDGFIRQEFGQRRPTGAGTLVNVGSGQRLTLNFSLQPAGVITGRVLNEDGEPLPRMTVQAYTHRYTNGIRSLVSAGSGQTNDLGEYRIFWLPPGEYFVSVLASNTTATRESRADLSASQAAGPHVRDAAISLAGPAGEAAGQVLRVLEMGVGAPEIYFPGALDPESAGPVALTAGAEVRGIDFSIGPIATAKIRGRVTSPVALPQRGAAIPPLAPGVGGVAGGAVRIAAPGGPIQVTLTRAGSPTNRLALPIASLGATTRVHPNGAFEIDNVVPGSYTLTAMARVPPASE